MVDFRINPFKHFPIWNARETLTDAGSAYKDAQEALKNLKDSKASGDVITEAKVNVKNAKKAFFEARQGLQSSRGEFFAGVRGMVTNVVEDSKLRLGFGDPTKIAAHTIKNDAGMAQRILSKPFRMAANRPGAALTLGGLAAVAAIGNSMHRHAEQRTQQDAMAEAMQPPMMPMGIAPVRQNMIDPNDPALLAHNARLRVSGENAPDNSSYAERMRSGQGADATPVANKATASIAAL